MTNEEKYNKAFIESFGIEKDKLNGLKYQDVISWDSIGHMQLMTVLEDEFGVELDIDDITDFSSYEEGKNILRKYDVNLNV
jgi:acyl carrier protein